MKKNIYLRSTFIDIRKSFGRFLSIVLIILMGVLLFVGIKSVGPNLEQTATNGMVSGKLSDLQIVSTGGLTEDDAALVEETADAQVELGHSFAYLDEENQQTLQLYSYSPENEQNQLRLVKGELPQKDTEILVDDILADQYPLGETLEIDSDQLNATEYTVVGYAQSPMYIANLDRGSTTIGDGQVDGFVYLPEGAFNGDVYSILYASFDELAEQSYFSDGYEESLDRIEAELETVFEDRAKDRQDELQAAARDELEPQVQEVATEKAQMSALYSEAIAEAQFAEAEAQLAAADEEIEALATPNYIIRDRSSNPGFNEFTSLSERIDAIANVFPVFFFFIAILITFTTMTRMIEENRREIGTLKALGYRNLEIASKYILYALLAATLGVTLGVLVGTKFLPAVVFAILQDQYTYTDYTTNFYFVPIFLAVLAGLLATLGSSLLVLTQQLQEKPTALLQAKAPKAGKRVFLERITPIWSRMSFNLKVTYRNLFRYKARMVLTILGIAGCTGLMLAGFGLDNSINAPADKQYNEIMHYQEIVTLADDAEEASDAQEVIDEHEEVQDYLPVFSEQVTFRKGSTQTASLYVTDDLQAFDNYFSFIPVGNDSVELSNDGAVISHRLAAIYDVSVGDQLAMEDGNGNEYELTVSGIVENYIGHNVYMTADYYQQLTDADFSSNTYLLQSNPMNPTQRDEFSEALLATEEVLNTTFIQTIVERQEAATENVGVVVWIFIVLSGTLAFVVLYNLTNINISERERELATIKVLGFYNKEVTMYILRENVVFTFFGILFGFVIGNVLTWFILEMAGSDLLVFPLIIRWQGYAVSAAMTAIFSAIVMGVTHVKLRHIHMIEALKSNE